MAWNQDGAIYEVRPGGEEGDHPDLLIIFVRVPESYYSQSSTATESFIPISAGFIIIYASYLLASTILNSSA